MPEPSPKRLWLFRLISLAILPLLLFALLEAGLRVGGFGYQTGFLLKDVRGGEEVLVSNPKFGWRHFGEKLARKPAAFSIAAEKPANTIRIFVFGESAAYGDPNPDFGLPRMLEAMLRLRHPDREFEVVNAAMTGINSHAVREIAGDCLKADADAWVFYMGNNEVVGPFGAGTVFGPATPPLPLIRASLAFKSTRTGQLFDRVRESVSSDKADDAEWGGMAMFTGSRVAADDERMSSVYHHFRRNLSALLDMADSHDIPTVISTVATNLRDSAPFASDWSKPLTKPQQDEWTQAFDGGVTAMNAGDCASALESFRKAAVIDAGVANLQFMLGHALLTTEPAEACKHFEQARDLDQLRFRCDTRLNELTRSVASGRNHQTRLVDAEAALNAESPQKIAGANFFYEHVHLTFEGNHRLALLFAREIETMLDDRLSPTTAAAWPSVEDCARALAWIPPVQRSVFSDVLIRLDDPPFTDQLSHASQVEAVQRALKRLAQAMAGPGALAAAIQTTREAVGAWPDDHVLRSQLSWLLLQNKELEPALEEADRALTLLPVSAEKHFQKAILLGQLDRYHEMVETLRDGLALDPSNVWALNDLATALRRTDNDRDAMTALRKATEINPRFGLAYLGIGELLEKQGDREAAEENFRKALAYPVNKKSAMVQVARFFHARKRFEEAAEAYTRVLRMDPLDAWNHLGAGQCLAALGRDAEAAPHFEAFARLSPDSPESRFLIGLQLARKGDNLGAVSHFAEAVRMKPDFAEAHINLASSLRSLGNTEEALTHYREALRLQPGNPVAVRSIAEIQAADQKSE